VAAGAPAASMAQGFEGVVSMSLPTDSRGQPPAQIVHMVKGTRSRQEISISGVASVTIFDAAVGTLTTLVPANKRYLLSNPTMLGRETAGAEVPPTIVATGKTETVAGRSCEHYLMGDATLQFDICAATGMGHFSIARAPTMRRQTAARLAAVLPPGWAGVARIFAEGLFPMKLERIQGAQRDLLAEVNRVEARTLEDSLFVPPSDYRELKISRPVIE
jgi:hypothetical protein